MLGDREDSLGIEPEKNWYPEISATGRSEAATSVLRSGIGPVDPTGAVELGEPIAMRGVGPMTYAQDMLDVLTTYKSAWRTVAEKVVVRYRSRGHAGHFYANVGRPPPIILITRRGQSPGSERLDESHEPTELFSDGSPLASDELLAELITLCHEFGHFTSFTTLRDKWDLYKSALDNFDTAIEKSESADANDHRRQIVKDVAPEERELIFKEEVLAWQIGRAFFEKLDGVGAGELETFDRQKGDALDTYRFLIAPAP